MADQHKIFLIAPVGDQDSFQTKLHAVRDDVRNTLVPLNKKYPIAQLLDACRGYPGAKNARRITFEYVMLKGVNDTPADARELTRLIAGIPAKLSSLLMCL